MQRETIEKWKKFQRSHVDVASRIRELILPACEMLHGKEPKEQIEIMQTDADCVELLQMLREHKNELAIQDNAYAYVAFMIKLCYCAVMRAENERTA